MLHKLVSFILIMVTLTLATAGLCYDAGAEEIASAKSLKTTHAAIPSLTSIKSNPIFPGDQSTDDDGLCGPCRYCACHAPLITYQIRIAYTPRVVIVMIASDPLIVLPEVYLPKFIPPQNLA